MNIININLTASEVYIPSITLNKTMFKKVFFELNKLDTI